MLIATSPCTKLLGTLVVVTLFFSLIVVAMLNFL
jgi:hypothetical protein